MVRLLFIFDSFTIGLKASFVSSQSLLRCRMSQQVGQETNDRLKLFDCNHVIGVTSDGSKLKPCFMFKQSCLRTLHNVFSVSYTASKYILLAHGF